jgi:peptide/nickel transport system permease protein/nickel transport system permease protein
MQHYIVRRILQLIPVLLGISLITFVLIQLMPSDPAVVVLRVNKIPVTLAAIAATREKLGLDRPLYIQYLDWLWNELKHPYSIRLMASQLPMHPRYRLPIDKQSTSQPSITTGISSDTM